MYKNLVRQNFRATLNMYDMIKFNGQIKVSDQSLEKYLIKLIWSYHGSNFTLCIDHTKNNRYCLISASKYFIFQELSPNRTCLNKITVTKIAFFVVQIDK